MTRATKRLGKSDMALLLALSRGRCETVGVRDGDWNGGNGFLGYNGSAKSYPRQINVRLKPSNAKWKKKCKCVPEVHGVRF